MMIFVVTLFFLTLVSLLALYLYVSGVFARHHHSSE